MLVFSATSITQNTKSLTNWLKRSIPDSYTNSLAPSVEKALFSQKSQLFKNCTSVLLSVVNMSGIQQTQTDPLIVLVAQQAALQVQIDQLIVQRATHPPST